MCSGERGVHPRTCQQQRNATCARMRACCTHARSRRGIEQRARSELRCAIDHPYQIADLAVTVAVLQCKNSAERHSGNGRSTSHNTADYLDTSISPSSSSPVVIVVLVFVVVLAVVLVFVFVVVLVVLVSETCIHNNNNNEPSRAERAAAERAAVVRCQLRCRRRRRRRCQVARRRRCRRPRLRQLSSPQPTPLQRAVH